MEKRIVSFSPPDISEAEIAETAAALRSGWITTGPRVKLLERRLAAYFETGSTEMNCETDEAKAQYGSRAVCLNSATAAEEMNLRLLGIQPGDEVLVPAYTYTATAAAAIHCGAAVKFIDCKKDGASDTHAPEMDYDRLADAVNEKTKAIISVDIGGIPCDYDRIFAVAEQKKHLFTPLKPDGSPLGDLAARIQQSLGRIAVVADAAHGLGASRTVGGKQTYCGSIADLTSFSFHAVKNLTTAEGGASAWRTFDGIDNAEIYRFMQLLSMHGQNKDALAKSRAGAWEYDIIGTWYKCNMTDIMGAIGLKQLDRYAGMLTRRAEIIRRYDAACDALGFTHLIHQTDAVHSANHLYLLRIPGFSEEQRNAVIAKMTELGVAVNVHYKPLPMMTAYQALGWDITDFPHAYNYYRNLISLPLHTKLTDEDVEYVCEALHIAVTEVRG
ncbi:MAG: DegT/DnrJ/EryC1/StrS family aminotransferase [Oscillospiraceae bacterium]|nr:DegT/DnrJ/EryC1/StrS family aminotransferase [Oscillospiraceae bacterium]